MRHIKLFRESNNHYLEIDRETFLSEISDNREKIPLLNIMDLFSKDFSISIKRYFIIIKHLETDVSFVIYYCNDGWFYVEWCKHEVWTNKNLYYKCDQEYGLEGLLDNLFEKKDGLYSRILK